MTVFSYLKHSGKLLCFPVPKRKNEKHKGYLECLFILQMTLMHNVIKTWNSLASNAPVTAVQKPRRSSLEFTSRPLQTKLPISDEFHCWVMGFLVFRHVLIRDKHAVWGNFLTVFQYKMMMVVVVVTAEMYLSTKAIFCLFYLIQLAG